MIDSANNRQVVAAVTAIARAQTRAPGVSPLRAIELAHKLEPLFFGYNTGEIVIACAALLLKGIGARNPFDLSRYRGN